MFASVSTGLIVFEQAESKELRFWSHIRQPGEMSVMRLNTCARL